MSPSPSSADRLASAAFVGWVPVAVVNAFFASRVPVTLGLRQSVLHHLYDAGQVLGLGAASWLLVQLLWRLPVAARVVVGCVLLLAAEHALLAGDLLSFLERHPDSRVPWHALLSVVGALGVGASAAIGYLLGYSFGDRRLRFAGIALGLGLAVANHLVLPLAYPGAHFTLAWCAALLLGGCLLRSLGQLRSEHVRLAAFGAVAVAVLSYAVPARSVVRSALLGSSGAVAAPFVAAIWTRLQGTDEVPASARSSPWFRPRIGLPAVAPERLPGAARVPTVVLLTVDAMRADLLQRPDVPAQAVRNLQAMRKRGAYFTRVWSVAPYTMASLRSLFVGKYYLQQAGRRPGKLRRAMGQREKLPSGPYLAALLEKRGVATTSFKTHRAFGRQGSICRGFGAEVVTPSAMSADVVPALIDALVADAAGPRFVYAHVMDPHDPYDRGGKRGTPFERYVAEVALVDQAIGKLREALRERGLDRSTYLIVAADHGEAFGEHGHDFHATTVYEEMIRIPLLIEGPGVAPREVDRAVSLLDLGPTILSLFGAPTPGHFMGQSLLPFMRGQRPELSRPLAIDGGRAIRAMLFEERWKAIIDVDRGTEEVYDLLEDPGERRNLAEEPAARLQLATLRAFFAGLNPPQE